MIALPLIRTLSKRRNDGASERRGPLGRLGSDQRGLAFVEFALALPMFLGFILAAIEFANYLIATQKVQKLAFMTSDMVARATIQPDEKQIEDIFLSLDVSAEPFDLRERGRVVLTGIVGIADEDSKEVENKLVWQRCDGSKTKYNSSYGKEDELDAAEREGITLNEEIELPQSQMIVTAEVFYDYEPIINVNYFNLIGVSKDLSAVSTLRSRSRAFTSITPVEDFEPKTC